MGSSKLVKTLLEQDLVDELNLMIEPIILGGGKSIFPGRRRSPGTSSSSRRRPPTPACRSVSTSGPAEHELHSRASPSPHVRDRPRFDLTARRALIVVDMQNDFGSAGGMFALRRHRHLADPGDRRTDRGLPRSRPRSDLFVVYLKMAFTADLADVGFPDSPTWDLSTSRSGPGWGGHHAPDGSPSRILVRDTWNTDIVDELTPQSTDIVLYKTRYSGFYGTDLEAHAVRGSKA